MQQPDLFSTLIEQEPEEVREPQRFPISTGNPDKVVFTVSVEFINGDFTTHSTTLLQGFWLKEKTYAAPLCLDKCVCPEKYQRCTKPADLKMLAAVIEYETGKLIDKIDVERVRKERE